MCVVFTIARLALRYPAIRLRTLVRYVLLRGRVLLHQRVAVSMRDVVPRRGHGGAMMWGPGSGIFVQICKIPKGTPLPKIRVFVDFGARIGSAMREN